MHHKHFHPTPSTAQRIEEAFVLYSIRKAQSKQGMNPDNLERLGTSLILFSNHRLKNLFSNSFENISQLDQAIPPCHPNSTQWFTNSTVSTDILDEKVIKVFLKKFSKNTDAQWSLLSDTLKESVTYSEFGAMRKRMLDYFAHRIQGYSKTKNMRSL